MSTSDLLFSFRGRLNRKPYWLVTLALIAIFIVLVVVAIFVGGMTTPAFIGLALLYIPFVWVGLALSTKRLHDRNKSAWWLLVFYVVPGILQAAGDQMGTPGLVLTVAGVGISIWAFVELGCLRGTPGPNHYGPDPLQTA